MLLERATGFPQHDPPQTVRTVDVTETGHERSRIRNVARLCRWHLGRRPVGAGICAGRTGHRDGVFIDFRRHVRMGICQDAQPQVALAIWLDISNSRDIRRIRGVVPDRTCLMLREYAPMAFLKNAEPGCHRR